MKTEEELLSSEPTIKVVGEQETGIKGMNFDQLVDYIDATMTVAKHLGSPSFEETFDPLFKLGLEVERAHEAMLEARRRQGEADATLQEADAMFRAGMAKIMGGGQS